VGEPKCVSILGEPLVLYGAGANATLRNSEREMSPRPRQGAATAWAGEVWRGWPPPFVGGGLKGGLCPAPFMGERLRGAGQPPSQRSSGRSIRSELLASALRSKTSAIAHSPQGPARRLLALVRKCQRRPPQPVAVPQQEEPFPLPLPLPRRFPLRAATLSTNRP
jgi:hypothetical protein